MDADKSNYLKYIKQMECFLNKESIIISDKTINFAELMKDYLNYAKTSEKYHSYLVSLDNGLMISVKLK